MSESTADNVALAGLREARDALTRPGAPLRVDLRDYVPEGSAAWRAFVRIRSESARSTLVPGHSVRRATMVGWLEEVIARLEAEGDAVETPADEPAEAPSPRDVPHAGERSLPTEEAPPRGAPVARGTPLRRLTADGIAEAQAFLTRLREQPDADRLRLRERLHDLLFEEPLSLPFNERIVIERRGFENRREAGAYLSERLKDVIPLVYGDAGMWSWLGMFYFPEIVRVKDGRVLLHADTSSLFLGGRAEQRRYRHYLWSAWRLHEQHGESVAYMLDQPLTDSGDIARAVFDYPRVFTSAGVIQLILQLYTQGGRTKRRFSARQGEPGSVRRLPAVLEQLELTYDVYGMVPKALLDVLPDDFRAWTARN